VGRGATGVVAEIVVVTVSIKVGFMMFVIVAVVTATVSV
jgi:hypothetical protein